jgi:hypothetical protein
MLLEVIARSRQRLLINVIAAQGAHALNGFLLLVVLIAIFGTDALEWQWLAIPPTLSLAAGGWSSWRRFPSMYATAQLIDRRLALADTLSTAIFFLSPTARKCDQEIRQAQRETASRVAAEINPCDAIPLRVPKAAMWSIVIAALAAGLLTMRYHVAGWLDLRPPLVPAVQRFVQTAREELAAAQRAFTESLEQLAHKDDATLTAKPESPVKGSNTKSSATASLQKAQAQNGAGKENAGSNSDMASDEAQGGGVDGAQDGSPSDRSDNGATQNTGQGHQNASRTDSAGQQNGNNSESSSLLNKVSNSMANLLSALKPRSAAASQQNAETGRGARPQGGREGRKGEGKDQGAQGTESSDGAQGSDATPGDKPAAGQNSDGQRGKQPGSGAGSSEGDKSLKAAEQRDAMGKISMIFGKRSQNLTGSAAVEVLSGEQLLTTRYQQKKVDHRDVHAKGERDEVPLELQTYVNQYFDRLRESRVRRSAQK